jgi:hypothetical protein
MELNLAHPQVMRQDIPEADDSLARAKAYQLSERQKCKDQLGIDFDANGFAILPRKASVLPFLNRDADAVFASPTAVSLVVTMQLRETLQAGAIAEEIAQTVHGVTVKELSAQQRADVLYAAVHALRWQKQCWKTAARQAGIAACETWLKTEGGKAFRDMTDEHRHALAVNLAPAIMCASFGISEGSKHLTPGEYLRITDGAK